jgi:hypothetical protein
VHLSRNFFYHASVSLLFILGDNYIPFAEIPSLRKMVMTGDDDEDMSYMRIQQPPTGGEPYACDSTSRRALSHR